ncbi:MAG: hypothetical protein F6J99_08335 [Moorea sp. SIO4G3]|nr:hypothetical protein [Moorena sp. SIO4G3]
MGKYYPEMILAFNGRIFGKAMQRSSLVKGGHLMSDGIKTVRCTQRNSYDK